MSNENTKHPDSTSDPEGLWAMWSAGTIPVYNGKRGRDVLFKTEQEEKQEESEAVTPTECKYCGDIEFFPCKTVKQSKVCIAQKSSF